MEKFSDIALNITAPDELVEFRKNQDFSSRLSEYITGLRPDDPKLVERLEEDQKAIRHKYGLLPLDSIGSPAVYEQVLRDKADEIGVKIRSTSDCGDFFEKYRIAGAAHFPEGKKIGVDIDRNGSYDADLLKLEHELIHAIQTKRYPAMPIELMEYEAYVSNGDMAFVRQNPKFVEMLFSYLIGGSVLFWYSRQTELQKKEVKPEWDNSEYFLDKVDQPGN